MGANAQTAVPAFTAGQVLTAAQQTQINTGIPVFAGTTERDAAFGGTGEKTLAEGQFAYIEATNTTQYYDGANWQSVASAGTKIGQVIMGTTTTEVSNSTTTYADTGLTATITPTLATSKVLVLVTQAGIVKTQGNSGNSFTGRTLRGATEIHVFAGEALFTNSALFNVGTISANYLDSPATTSATTYKTQFKNGVAAAAVSVQTDSVIDCLSTIILLEVLV